MTLIKRNFLDLPVEDPWCKTVIEPKVTAENTQSRPINIMSKRIWTFYRGTDPVIPKKGLTLPHQ